MKLKCPNCGCMMSVATLSERAVEQPPNHEAYILAKRAKADARRIAKGIDPVKARRKKLGRG